ncbi:MAG: M15 family metallopeptidase [Lachnospiraceae bacterium]|nr:M15 family metallopeptidase [Lachnospiraceae bacterium]
MKKKNIKHIIFALECVALILVAVMLGHSVIKANRLSAETEALKAEVEDLKEQLKKADEEKVAREEAAKEQEKKAAETQAVKAEPTLTQTPAPTPTETPTPTPVVYLTDLSGVNPGEIIDDALIDPYDIGKYFTSSVIVEGDEIFNRIIDRSFRYNDNIALSDLRYIKLLHRNYEGQTQVGELIVNAAIEADVIDIFMQFYLNGYQIHSMYLIDNFWAGDGDSSDFASIDVNNTSAFCYRTVTGSSNLSNHAYGLAIDLNPLENPYVRIGDDGYGTSAHANAQAYNNNRSSAEMPHVIDHEDLAYQLFSQYGFTWGGDWNNPKDYQHFQKEFG